ncbi:hypothetical protein QZH41_020235 [Actinostola sp. cb2023]|nr:hypothetical protein QZH41_020235 [Actinostola sp. cb2023]
MDDDVPQSQSSKKNTPSNSQPKQVCHSIDSGVGSFEEGESTEGKDPVMTSAGESLNPAAAELLQNGEGATPGQRFQFVYLGFAVLDRRYTQSMLPWVISEVRRRKERNHIFLCVEESAVKALNVADGSTSFQHGVQTITRCARSLDKKCFAYLVKSNDSTCSCFCYVFESVDNLSVPGFIHCIKETVKGSCDSESKHKRKTSSFESTSTEVQNTIMVNYPLNYVGKVVVSHRQAPPTLIDDSVERFKNLNRRMELESELHQNHCPQEYSSNVITRQSPPETTKSNLHKRAVKAASLDAEVVIGECDPKNLPNPDLLEVLPSNGDVRPRSASDGDKKHYNPSGTKERSDSDHTSHATYTRSASFGTNAENRNVVLQISPFSVLVVSSATNSPLMEKKLREISFCQQGSKNSEHFGFICREQRTIGYVCYVFKGETEFVVDSVMRSLKQAFHAAWQATGSTNVCELCPLHHLHLMCTQLEGCTPSQQHEQLQKELVLLSEEEMDTFTDKYKAESPITDMNEEVEVVMTILRAIYEKRQKMHTHTISNQIPGKDKTNLLQKAKKSIANSLESFRSKRGRSRTLKEDNIDETNLVSTTKFSEELLPSQSIRHRSHTIDTLGSGPTPPMSPIDEKPPVNTLSSNTHQKLQRRGFTRNKSTESLPETFRSNSSPPHTPTRHNTQMHRKLSRQHSYRQNIFNSVVTPSKRSSVSQADAERTCSWSEMTGRKRSSQELRALWRKSIMEQIILIRMDRENKTLDDIQKSVELKRLKLTYEGPYWSDSASDKWDELLGLSPDEIVDPFILQQAIKAGLPKLRRGDVWVFLSNQFSLRASSCGTEWSRGTYGVMREGHSLHQHSIFIDLGRTFPGHPYFMSQFGPGQLSLFNLLKAYSIHDIEVGYCQGLSFVAGILLMHMDESQAFDTMRHLMYDLSLRKLYKSDMQELQIQFYMLSRLLHDFHPALYEFLEELEITPTLYSAGWFLTLFASMFPVGVVVRIMDMILLQGMSVVFKVMLVLLGRCKEGIVAADGFENAVEYIKTFLPPYAFKNLDSIVDDVLDLDITKQLESYLIEYNVLREEDLSLASIEDFEHERAKKLEVQNNTLSRHLQELTEQLSSARKTIQSLESTITTMQINQSNLLSHIRAVKAENEALKKNLAPTSASNERNKLRRSHSIEVPDPPLSPQEHSSLTDENTDSFEHIGCNDLTDDDDDDEAGSLDRDSPEHEVAEKHGTSSPLLSDKVDDLAVSR